MLAMIVGYTAAGSGAASAAGWRVPDTTACSGPPDFGAQYLSSAWPGGFTGVPVYSNDSPSYKSN
jgi:hypothetical protein